METTEDEVVVEHELDIVWNGRTVIRLSCTPQHLAELTGGFLLTSGYVNHKSDIELLRVSECGSRAEVETAPGSVTTVFDWPVQSDGCLSRPVPRLSQLEAVTRCGRIDSDAVKSFMLALQASSQIFRATGGTHVAALGRDDGGLSCACEDIGRHNAVDKVAGMMMLQDAQGVALALSGRISSDIVQKAARMGLPLIVSRSAPTRAAIELAQQTGITMVGFARGQRFNVYGHPQRIIGADNP